MMSRNYSDLYGLNSKKKDDLQYETIELPIQDQVSIVRKFVCKTWQSFKVEKDKLKNTVTTSLENVTTKTKGTLKSVGIENTSVALQAGAIGTAALVGVVAARRKSAARRILYPTLAAGLVWATIFCSAPENRSYLRSQLDSLQKNITKSK